jgi:broad specificity phosphatase PhoE
VKRSALAAALSVDLETDVRLGELHQGPWQGLVEPEVARRWPLEWSVWRGGMDAARRPGRLPAHRCGQLLNHDDSRIRLWPRLVGLNDTGHLPGSER